MAKYRIPGHLGYNAANDRYGLLNSDLWEHEGFHCGEGLEIWDYDGERWIPAQVEMDADREWYLVGTGLRGDDLEGVRASIIRGYSETGLELDSLELVEK